MSEAVIDLSTFSNLTELVGDDFISELVETLFEEGPGLLEEMRLALDSGDAETFRRSAHSLKSNGASFGATQLASLARDMEYMGRDNQLDEAVTKMPDLESEYERAAEALQGLL